MRNSLLTLSLAVALGGTSAVIAAAQADAPEGRNPVLLAQASPEPFTRPLPLPERRVRAPLSPEQATERRQEMCEDRADRLAGQLAYLEARLDLTAGQRPAFDRWRDIRLAAAQRQARTCAERPLPGHGPDATRPNPVEQMARREEVLRQRLADLQIQRPALETLYNSLSPEQREKFSPVGDAGMRPRMAMMMRDRLIQRGGMRGPDGRGPMGPPPGGPGAPPAAQ
ncbi:MAG TPA: Spy/CpxP family protein refolding chaperone [Rhizomicrobium sp.]|nr:Spy/CpxP family protein refolding chaperone [Rhizomicrobium sp.]